jgi:arylsulfatase A-like enzyme
MATTAPRIDTSPAGGSAGRRRPNVLLLMADQQKATSLPFYGNPDTRTPTLSALAAGGVVAETCFTAHPFCLPSRAALLTGRYAHATGTRSNAQSLSPDEVPLAEILRAQGYRTGAVGHFHGGRGGGDRGMEYAMEVSAGDQRVAMHRHHEMAAAAPRRVAHMAGTTPVPVDDYVDGVITRDALRFLEGVGDDEPFFLHVAWMAPHPPYFVCPPYDTLYDPQALTYPRRETAAERAGKPDVYRETAQDMGTLDAPEGELRRALAHYYGMVTLLDDQLARLLEALRRRGRLEDTIVVYTADHGDYAGEHDLWAKSCTLYDCLVRVPLIVSGPEGLVPRGLVLDGMVQTVDVTPTLLDLLGLPIPSTMQGLSLRPAWRGEPFPQPAPHRIAGRTGLDIAFAEVGSFAPEVVGPANRERGNNIPHGPPASGRQVELSAMARTSRWKLIVTPGREIQELYDLQVDPGELHNRYGEPETEPVVAHLRSRLQDWLLTYT